MSKDVSALVKRGQTWYRRQFGQETRSGARSNIVSEQSALAGLNDPRAQRRWEAAAALKKNGQRSQQAIEALSLALADDEPFVRWQAAEALAAQDPGRVFPVLRTLLAEGDPLARGGAAAALGRMGGEAATVELRQALADPDPAVRAQVARALGGCGDPTAGAALVPLLEDADPEVVCSAAHALGQIGDSRAACALGEVLERPGQGLLVRRALAAALARAPHPEVQPILLAAFADPDPQVRGYAAAALGPVGNEEALGPLTALRSDPSPLINGTVGDEASRALSALERRGHRRPAAADEPAAHGG